MGRSKAEPTVVFRVGYVRESRDLDLHLVGPDSQVGKSKAPFGVGTASAVTVVQHGGRGRVLQAQRHPDRQ